MATAAAKAVTRLATPLGRLYKIPPHTSVTGGGQAHAVVPGVTSVLGMVDKSSSLVSWAVRTALAHVRSELDVLPPAMRQTGDLGAWFDGVSPKAAAAPDDVKLAAAAFGTRAHAAIDADVQGSPLPAGDVAPDVAPVLEGFRKWYAGAALRLSPAGDTVVYNRRYGYAGATDALGVTADGSKLVVVDFKTSNAIHDTYAMQLAAYAYAVADMVAAGELVVPGWTGRLPAAAAAAAPSMTPAPVRAPSRPGVSFTAYATTTYSSGGGGGSGADADTAGGDSGIDAAAPLPASPRASSHKAAAPATATARAARTAAQRSAGATASSGSSGGGGSVIVDESLFPAGLGRRSLHGAAAAEGAAAALQRVSALDASAPAVPIEALVVRFDKASGEAEVKRVADLSAAFDAFKAALVLWHVSAAGKLLVPA